jgi:hypothetical protein
MSECESPQAPSLNGDASEFVRLFHAGGRATLAAGPAYLNDDVLDVAVISSQKTRDLLYREAAYEHVAQLDHRLEGR